MKYEILDGATVINTIMADADFMALAYPAGNYRAVPEDVALAAAEPRHITVGAFFDRFGAAKWSILADTNPGVQALIKDCSVRKYIDLDNPVLAAGLGMLIDAGHAIDATAITGAEVLPGERT